MTWGELAREAEARFREAGLASPEADARWIMQSVSPTSGRGDEQDSLNSLQHARFDALVERRAAGEPLQYVVGEWQFRRVDLFVDRRVLIPRPETEITAKHAIDAARARSSEPHDAHLLGEHRLVVVDLGTGSGAIALAVADELAAIPELEIWATDASEDALAVARANLAGAGSIATRVRLAHGDWFEALPAHLAGTITVLVSNPPYISESEVHDLPSEVRDYEPYGALVSGPTGLEAIEHITSGAPDWLAPGGALVVELSPPQADVAAALARDAGFTDIAVHRDLADRDRVLVAHLAS